MSTQITMSHIAQQLNEFIKSSMWTLTPGGQVQLLFSLMREDNRHFQIWFVHILHLKDRVSTIKTWIMVPPISVWTANHCVNNLNCSLNSPIVSMIRVPPATWWKGPVSHKHYCVWRCLPRHFLLQTHEIHQFLRRAWGLSRELVL